MSELTQSSQLATAILLGSEPAGRRMAHPQATSCG